MPCLPTAAVHVQSIVLFIDNRWYGSDTFRVCSSRALLSPSICLSFFLSLLAFGCLSRQKSGIRSGDKHSLSISYAMTSPVCSPKKRPVETRVRAQSRDDSMEADSYRKQPGESWAAFGIRKYRLLKRAYEGSDEANIILKIKAVMDTDVVRFCKEKANIDSFVGELMDYDRTTPAAARSPPPRRTYPSGSEFSGDCVIESKALNALETHRLQHH
jgi:hypothetical protein